MDDELFTELVKTVYLVKYIKRVFEEEGIQLDDFELREPIELKKEVFELFDKYRKPNKKPQLLPIKI